MNIIRGQMMHIRPQSLSSRVPGGELPFIGVSATLRD